MAACALRAQGGRVAEARIAVGAVTDRPTLLADVATLVEGHAVDAALAREAGEAASRTVDPADSLHASAAYQRHLTGVLVQRVVLSAWERAR
jgi:carbon-monoxide dehydrogenase medium subunit